MNYPPSHLLFGSWQYSFSFCSQYYLLEEFRKQDLGWSGEKLLTCFITALTLYQWWEEEYVDEFVPLDLIPPCLVHTQENTG